MTIFFLKSLLSLALLLPVGYGMSSMFRALGSGTESGDAARLRRNHRIAGYFALALLLCVSYLCIAFTAASNAESTPRAAVHIVLALSVLTLLAVKVLFIRRFRRFYGQATAIGIVISVMCVVMIGVSGGYYLAMTRFGAYRSADKSISYRIQPPFLSISRTDVPGVPAVRTDRASINRGRALFAARCSACHDPLGTGTIVGPGLKGLLKGKTLPKSGHPATPESIRFQLRQPLGAMPSFAYLSSDEMEDLIAYLNTL